VKKGKVDYAHFGAAGLGLVAGEDIEVRSFSALAVLSHLALASGHPVCCSVEVVHKLRSGYRILEALSSAMSDHKPEKYVASAKESGLCSPAFSSGPLLRFPHAGTLGCA
jgi:hypothetical protein